jgi:signal transduction histidine kinase
LGERTRHLLKANQELAMSAKTSALGAVTSHLIHGLKSPLAGLQNFMASRDLGGADPAEAEWREAAMSTRRMESLIGQIVNVLREEQTGAHYELTLAELVDIVAARAEPLVREAQLRWVHRLAARGTLSNRTANLVALILLNLIQNAVQVSLPGRTVSLMVAALGDRTVFEVHDEGPGVPPALRENLFVAQRSSKQDGCGIGLAISKQLAHHLGASLELKHSSDAGTVFALTLPLEAAGRQAEPPEAAAGR